MFGDVAQRVCEPEIMDDPSLDGRRHRLALAGLARLNRLSRSAASLWRPIAELSQGEPLRILDLATGSGDIPMALWRHARRQGQSVEICGIDISPIAIEYARRRAAWAAAPVRFEVLDALCGTLSSGFDVVCCSLFLHHLRYEEAILLLRRMREASERMVLVSDLVRNRRGLWLARAATRLFTASEVARVDGPRSVQAAFTLAEFGQMARDAGLDGAVVKRSWPCRMLLQWKR